MLKHRARASSLFANAGAYIIITVSEYGTKGRALLKRHLRYGMCRWLLPQPSEAGTAHSSVIITLTQPFKKLNGDILARHHSQANDRLPVMRQCL